MGTIFSDTGDPTAIQVIGHTNLEEVLWSDNGRVYTCYPTFENTNTCTTTLDVLRKIPFEIFGSKVTNVYPSVFLEVWDQIPAEVGDFFNF